MNYSHISVSTGPVWVPVCTFIIRTYLFQFEEFHWYNYCRTCEFRGRASQFCSATMIFLSKFVPHVWFSWPHFWLQISTDILQYSSAYYLNTCICLSVPAFRWNCVESGKAGRDGICHSRDHIGSNKLCRACRDCRSSRIFQWCALYASVNTAEQK